MRKPTRGATLPTSGGPTCRSIERTAGSPGPEDEPSTSDQEIGLVKAGALNKFMDPVRWRALDGRWRLQMASNVGPDGEAVSRGSRFGKGSVLVIP